MSSKSVPTTIHFLAPELHHHILNEVARPATGETCQQHSQNLLSCGLVCRDWLEHSLKLLHLHVTLDSIRKFESFRGNRSNSKKFKTVRMRLENISQGGTQGESRFGACQAIRSLLVTCPDLVGLEIAHVGVWPWYEAQAIEGPLYHLKFLRLGDGILCASNDFRFVEMFLHLQHLSISGDLTWEFLSIKIARYPSTIEHLELESLHRDNSHVGEITYNFLELLFPQITTLTLHFGDKEADLAGLQPALSVVLKCSFLTHLKLSFCPFLTPNQELRCFSSARCALEERNNTLAHLTFLSITPPSPLLVHALTALLVPDPA